MGIEFQNTFAVLPSWGNKTFKTNNYSLYIINEDFFGLCVKSQFMSAQEAINYIGVFIKKYPTEAEFFSACRAYNYGQGICRPHAERAYVEECLNEIGNPFYVEIEAMVLANRKVPIKPTLKPLRRKFVLEEKTEEIVEQPTPENVPQKKQSGFKRFKVAK